MIVHAETGSGKTLCYALPLVAALDDASTNLPAIVVAPTLALSSQIAKVLNTLRPDCAAALRASDGDAAGAPGAPPERLPSAPVVVGPPAMLLRLLGEKGEKKLQRATVGGVRTIVVDEADALLRPLSKYATHEQKERREALGNYFYEENRFFVPQNARHVLAFVEDYSDPRDALSSSGLRERMQALSAAGAASADPA